MANHNSKGSFGRKPADRSSGPRNYSAKPERSSGEGKKIFNRNDKPRSSENRDRKPYGDAPSRGGFGGNSRSERPYNSERSFSKDRSFNSDRNFNNRNTDRPARNTEGGENEFRPYRPAADRRPKANAEDRPWVNRASRSEFGSVPRGGKGERNRSFKPEKEEYRAHQEEKKVAAPRKEENDGPRIAGKKSFYGQKPTADFNSDRKPRAKKSFGFDDKKSFGAPEKRYSEKRDFNNDRGSSEGSRFSQERRTSRESQAPRENRFNQEGSENRPTRNARPYTENRAPREDRFSKDGNSERGGRTFSDSRGGEKRSFREDRPARPDRAERPNRFEDRKGRNTHESVGEAPNYSGMKRYSNRDKNRSEDLSADGQLRLNRYIANAGICSRREADELITAGEIKVNGEVVTELGYKVQPSDTVQYGKKNLNREKLVYVLLNKPKDFITTTEDPEGRKTVMDLVANASKERIFPVGRLDRNTTGLLLFTNDGELAQKLTHPSHKNSKIYQVELDKPITREDFEKVQNGLELEDGKAIVDDLALIGNSNKFVGIEIHIGRNRIVRRIFESLGYEVVTLDRVQYAGLTKKDLPRGNWRFLNEKEVIRLKYFLK